MAANRRVYDSRHLQADCQEPGLAPELYALQSSMGYLYLLPDNYSINQQTGTVVAFQQKLLAFLLAVKVLRSVVSVYPLVSYSSL